MTELNKYSSCFGWAGVNQRNTLQCFWTDGSQTEAQGKETRERSFENAAKLIDLFNF